MREETELARILRVGRERQEEAEAVRTIHAHCEVAGLDEKGDSLWFDVRTARTYEKGWVGAAVWLLEYRDLLDRHPDNRHVVRCWERA